MGPTLVTVAGASTRNDSRWVVGHTVTVHEKTRIGDRYELGAPLGRGAMGEVWRGYDRQLDRRVAVKLIRRDRLPDEADYDKFRKRFLREARLAAKLDHPCVPAVYDAGVHEGVAFLVMQLITGHDVADVLAERGPLPVPWVTAIGAQVCSVLAAAHAASLVHRDLKTRNLMLCPDGLVKVLDFGIAMVVDSVDFTRLTTTGHTMGTPAYMSPEQVSGGEVGPATDLYALGCVLYELLTGRTPFVGNLPIAVATQHMTNEPPPLRPARPDVPVPLAELVQKLLAKTPSERPGAAEVYHRLVPYIDASAADSASHGQELGPTRPFVFPLGPLPVLPGPATTELSALVAPSRSAASALSGGVDALDRQRERAVELLDEGRVTQAAQVLSSAARAAATVLGADHPDVVDARMALVHVYLLGGDHQRALPELQGLVPDLEKHYGPGHDFVWSAKRNIIECQVALGHHGEAMSAVEELIAEREARPGRQDAESAELRYLLSRLRGEGV